MSFFRIDTPDFVQGSDFLERVFFFAMEAHERVEQLRKYTGEPYIVHPVAVARIVASTKLTDDSMVAAALLHDTVEDTDVTLNDIWFQFGYDVETLVYYLTDVSRPEDGNRATRKAIDREHTASGPARAQTIKVADLIDNTRSIVEHDPDFAEVYIEEKALLLERLVLADPALRAQALSQVQGFQEAALQEALRQ